ncbi:calcium/sodium antiporter [Alkaliphilus transvaalensis]|uniref:calcium/sodium antiporter n=1 Tax=Alkaliphilus transvaalensis TaxID=114628 RepID=UPI00047ABA86|nr:calcium/sodium antiporter [Alkaliphilus transvaalensis]
MENFMTFFLFIIGIFMVMKGGDWFVESAVWVGKITGIPNVIIGATIVSTATTLPELLVSIEASRQQFYDVAIGNAIGSIICNLGLILGIMAIISPPQKIKKDFFKKTIFMIFSLILLLFFFTDLSISKIEGAILLMGYIIYILLIVRETFKEYKKDVPPSSNKGITSKKFITRNLSRFVIGAIFIIIGARLLVDHGVGIANLLGVPQRIISLTLLAVGTSLPELVTGITAIIKKEYGLSIGNILGANTLNALLVIGLSSQVSFGSIFTLPQTLFFDLPVALLLSTILFAGGVFFKKINRTIGIILLLIYGCYIFTMTTFLI